VKSLPMKVKTKVNLQKASLQGPLVGDLQGVASSWTLSSLNGDLTITENALKAQCKKAQLALPAAYETLGLAQSQTGDLDLDLKLETTKKQMTLVGRFGDSLDAKLRWQDQELQQGQILIQPQAQTYSQWPTRERGVEIRGPAFHAQWQAPLIRGAGGDQRLQLERLVLPEIAQRTSLSEHVTLSEPLSILIESATVGGLSFGKVALQIKPQASVWEIPYLRIDRPNFTLRASGIWDKKQDLSRMKGKVSSPAFGRLLEDWGQPTDLKEGQLSGSFECHWPGNPMTFSWYHLFGQGQLLINNGRLTGVEPGFARLLGLFSLENIFRRLRFDFRDLFKKGFIFDTATLALSFKGSEVDIRRARVQGPSADIHFSGKTDTQRKTLGLYVMVSPKGIAQVPVAAAMVVNPALGAGVWFIDKLVGSPLSKGQGIYYRVSGTWKEPRVEQVPAFALPED